MLVSMTSAWLVALPPPSANMFNSTVFCLEKICVGNSLQQSVVAKSRVVVVVVETTKEPLYI